MRVRRSARWHWPSSWFLFSIHLIRSPPPHCAHQTLHNTLFPLLCPPPPPPGLAHLLLWGFWTGLNDANRSPVRVVYFMCTFLLCDRLMDCRIGVSSSRTFSPQEDRRKKSAVLVGVPALNAMFCRFLLANKRCTPTHLLLLPLRPPHSPRDFSPGIYAKHALVSLAEAERGDGLADNCK